VAGGYPLLETLLVLVLSIHLLAANLAGAGPLVAIWLDVRETRRHDALAGEVGRYLARQSLIWLSVGVALGAATLGLVWLVNWESFYETARRLPASRFWWAVPELAFYYVCMGAYLYLWKSPDASGPWRAGLRRALGLLAATNLLYHFPLLFTVIGVYGTRIAAESAPLNFRQTMFDPEVFSQFMHHVLASFAVVGVAMMGFALRLGRAGRTDDAQRIATWGGRVALAPTVLQLFVGVYVLLELPGRARNCVMGGDAVGTLLFIVALVAAIVLMHRLASVAVGEAERRDLIGSMALLVLVVVAMVGTRQRTRQEKFISATDAAARVAVGAEAIAIHEEHHGGNYYAA
jgi:hypothetical protein